jgi:hypothetical protein
MPETLSTADGAALTGVIVPPDPLGPDPSDQAFAKSMAAGGQSPDYPPPRHKRDPEAPHGRGPDGVPLAPYGHNQKTGRPNITQPGPGRGGKKDPAGKARVQDAASSSSTSSSPTRTDYTADLADFADGLWAGLAFLPPTQAQATILKANTAGLVQGFNLSAAHNPLIRRGVEYVSGEGGWMINSAMLIAPFALQSFALWFRPATLKDQVGASKEELAQIAKDELQARIEEQKAALTKQIAEHQAELAAAQQEAAAA